MTTTTLHPRCTCSSLNIHANVGHESTCAIEREECDEAPAIDETDAPCPCGDFECSRPFGHAEEIA